jgi:hypothetical protein
MSTKSQANMSPMSPTDYDVALYLQREKGRLPEKHYEFIDRMVHCLRPVEPTPKQRQYLHSLFFKLGGRIDAPGAN